MEAKEWGITKFKSIVAHFVSDVVWPITKWAKLSVGPDETLFLQVQPNLVTYFEGMQNPMLIMTLLILGIGFL
jgi:hypothetical protein